MVKQSGLLTGNASDFLKIGVGAAARGDLETLKAVLHLRPAWRSRIGSHGRTMLWEAAYRGRLNVVSYLLDTYDDIDIEARGCHYTPLLVEISPVCAAILKKRTDVVTRLEAAGAKRDVVTQTYLGVFDDVEQMTREDPSLIAREIVQHDPHFDGTLLHYAVAGAHPPIVKLLIERGADVTRYSNHLLDFSLNRNSFAMVEMLLDAGMDVTERTLLKGDIADTAIVTLLQRYGAKIEIDASENGWPSLVYVCRGDRGGNPDAVRELIAQGANVNITNYKGQTALHCAAKAGFVEPVRILLDHGAHVNAQDRDGDTPLHTALKSSIKDQTRLQQVIDLLLQNGADIEMRNRLGRTPSQVKRRKSAVSVRTN